MLYKDSQTGRGCNIQAIIFDAVGTLIAPCSSVGEIYVGELAKLGYHLDPTLLEKNFRHAFKKFKQEQPDALLNRSSWYTIVTDTLQNLTPKSSFDRQFEILWNAFATSEYWRILPSVTVTLKELQATGMRLFVLSNNDKRLHVVLDGLAINEYFEEIFVSSELGAEKPSPLAFKRVEERIKTAPESILHVGDGLIEDIQGALQAGWNAALIAESPVQIPPAMMGVKQAGNIHQLFCNFSKK